MQVFSENNRKYLNLELYKQNDNSSALDGLRIIFEEGANNAIGAGDIQKLSNLDENFARLHNNRLLMVEHRDTPTNQEELQLFINAYKHQNYRIRIHSADFEQVDAYLVDNYTSNELLLEPGLNEYVFQVNPSSTQSSAFNRFKIEFRDVTFSIQDFSNTDVVFYPNPVQHSFTVELPETAEKLSFEIFDIVGKKISKESYSASIQTNILEVSHFYYPSGVYLLKIYETNKTISTHKFIKE
jgi:hypothetical protein